jgi:CubicO group peptidase (beta-lactamase class C family)
MRSSFFKTLALGLFLCVATLFFISEERHPALMLLNIGAFTGILTAASSFFILIILLRRRLADRSSSLKPGWRDGRNGLRFGIAVLIGFALFFHDYSEPREIGWGQTWHYDYQQPTSTDDGWETASLTEADINPEVINHLMRDLVTDKAYKGMHSVLIARDGKLVFEEYFYDETIDTPHPLRSANKSLTSILIGVAVKEGLIESVDDNIYDYFPEIPGAGQPITIRHLLTMTGGLDANDWNRASAGNESKIYRLQQDWTNFYLNLPIKNPPGSQFAYSTGGEMVLRDLITRVSGQSLQDYTQERLLEPLGINQYQWHRYAFERDDLPVRLNLRSRDMLKIGQLYLDKGRWQDHQIVNADWVAESTTQHAQIDNERMRNPGYGYFWWKHPFQVNGQDVDSFAAQGSGGQFIFVLPEQQLVVVFTQGNYGNRRRNNPFRIMRALILPSIK